jgi:hypothetical protein
MNERIEKLALQAGWMYEEEFESHYKLYQWEDFDKEKFAELIVRECAEICLEANDHKNILRHFGVEE